MSNAFPVKLTISIPGQQALGVSLSRYSSFITNFSVFFTDYFLPLWYAYLVFNYTSRGADTGDEWAPLNARYAAWKEKHYPGQPIGVLTGATRTSLTTHGGAHSILELGATSFVAGTDLNYPIFLQLGTSKMPARPPMRVNKDFLIQVGKALQEFANDSAGKLGLSPES